MNYLPTTFIILLFIFSFSIIHAQKSPKKDMDVFLSQGISEGLMADKFPRKRAKELLEIKELWVVKCPICRNVKKGLSQYINKRYKRDKTLAKKILKKGKTDARRQLSLIHI